jgi:predicted metal-dependent hydrolase
MIKKVYVRELDSEVVIARRKGTRNIRISLKGDGQVRLAVPFGITEDRAMKFLLSKSDWINKNKKDSHILGNGILIGKSHRLHFIESSSHIVPKARVSTTAIIVHLPTGHDYTDKLAQTVAKQAGEKALKKDAEHLLPQRLKTLADHHGIKYKSVAVKKLKSRWGSCDSYGNVVLNTYLIQLPWKLIDYVIIHELCHVLHHDHSSDFWAKVDSLLPDFATSKKKLKSIPTDVIPSEVFY